MFVSPSRIAPLRSIEFNPTVVAAVLIVGLLAVDTVVFLQSLRIVRRDGWWIAHTHQVTATLDSIWSDLAEFESDSAAYLVTGNAAYLNSAQSARRKVEQTTAGLSPLIADNAEQSAAQAELQTRLARRLEFWSTTVALRERQGFEQARAALEQGDGKQPMNDIRLLLRQMQEREERLLSQRTATADFNYGLTLTTAGVAGITGLALATAAGRMVRRELVGRQQAEALSEERRRQLELTLTGIGDAVLCADTGGRITFLNTAAESITGWPAAEAKGQPLEQIFRIVDEETRQTVVNPARIALETGKIVGLANHTILLTRDAREVAIDDSAAPIYGAGQEITGVVLVFRDITARRSVERLEAERHRYLQENERRRDVFLALLAHELRNPLAPLSNCVDMLGLQAGDSERIATLREVMSRQIQALVRLIDDLLDVSRINRGIFALRLGPVDLNQSLQAAVESVRPLLDSQRHELIFAPAEPPLQLRGDSVRLTQAVGNLLNNAAKFTPPGGKIQLTMERDRKEGVIRLQDSGIGMPAKQIERIFDMFVQLDESHTRKHGGLGVGLSLAKHIIDKHGGSLTAHSPGPGQGSEFVIRLPVSAVEREKTVTTDHPAGDGSPVPPPLYNPPTRKILVVDDMKTAADMVTRLLILLGQRVRTTHDAQSALLAIEEEPFDLLISDIAMPEMSGYELATRLRSDPRHQRLTLIALTGYGQESDARRAREAGFDHHIVKPVGIEHLRTLLNSLSQSAVQNSGLEETTS
jgi:PAS domain S-box-containing protein